MKFEHVRVCVAIEVLNLFLLLVHDHLVFADFATWTAGGVIQYSLSAYMLSFILISRL